MLLNTAPGDVVARCRRVFLTGTFYRRLFMPRKRPIQPEAAAASSNSHRKKPVIGPFWRQNLFYLHGDVYTDGDETVWEGTWLASEGDLPSARQFAEAPDSFKLTTRDFLGTGIFLEEHSPIGTFYDSPGCTR